MLVPSFSPQNRDREGPDDDESEISAERGVMDTMGAWWLLSCGIPAVLCVYVGGRYVTSEVYKINAY